ncbi:hypothetical protein L7F22_044578 [Adiantum nelumboides]|nr:hypothetical protein [Adiantum nelumboides]
MGSQRKLVIAVDESDASDIAFRWVLHNLARKSDHIVVLNSAPYVGLQFPDPDIANEYIIPSVASVEAAEVAEKAVTEKSKVLVSKYLTQCQEIGVSCEGEVVKGEPASWIVDESERLHADVVAVGSKDLGVIKRTLLGSVADEVLHNAHCPVVIVRSSEALQDNLSLQTSDKSRNIVIAVDDSKEAVDAFVWALHNFCKETDKVTIYHVHNSTVPSVTAAGTGEFGMEEVYVTPDSTDEMEVKALTDSEKLVERFMAYMSRETKVSCEGLVVTGQTEAMVCEGLAALKADAVVVGSHDKGVLARTFLGSVSDFLAHESPCPVIVVKQRKTGEVADLNGSAHIHTS